jgi:superfamily II DNA or RNA helicase
MGDLAALLAGLDAGERVRGRGFERLCKWVLENEPAYAARLERVWLWGEWPGRWAADAGIDLVAQDREGGLWAVQAKHYDPAYAIRKADLDSFLSESSRPQFSYRLLIASTDHLGASARRTLDAQEKPAGRLLRSDLAALELAWPRSLAQLRPARLTRKRPRPHQRHAVKDVVAGLAMRDRGQLVMACGTGKTLAARFLHDELGSKRTLVLVPSLSLVKQTIREWFTVGDVDYLAVCSDDTVATQDRDAVVASTSELGIPVTTDAIEIAAFLRKRGGRARVVFATYQSSQRIAAAQAGRTPAFDLVVADEAHRCAGPEAGLFATVLDPDRIKARKRLFMTATPRYYTGRLRKEASEADWEIVSMDDEQKFGPVLHRLTFAQAIEQDLLSDYQVVVVGVSDTTFKEMAQRAAFVTADGETITDARTLASQLGLLRAMRNHDLHRVVSFHSRIRSAREFATSLPNVSEWMPPRRRPTGRLWTQHVSGEMSSGEREVRLNQLREVGAGERGVLTNARCLTEGVDVPTLDGVAFIEPRRSQVDIVQAVGRAMRKADDKTVGTIVIPVFVDEHADPELALDSSEFDRVWQVVKALRAHDEVLADELDELRRELGRRTTSNGRPGKVVLDLPLGVGTAFARAFDTRLVVRNTTTWEEGIGAAAAYREAKGDLLVPQKLVTVDGFKLGVWINNRRVARTRGDLTDGRIAELDALGMVWDALEEDWRRGIVAARAYREAHDDLLVPRKYIAAEGFKLGGWIDRRRTEYRGRKLTSERIAELVALGMVWNPLEGDWQRGIKAARAYREAHGDLLVPQKFVTADGFKFGTWINTRRTKRDQLSSERIAELDKLGMVWFAPAAEWQRGIKAARAYREAHGDLLVPQKFVTADGFRLGGWINERRHELKRQQISQARVDELDALGMVWHPRREQRLRGIAAARAYRQTYGHLRVPVNYVTIHGFRLGTWLSTRRVARKRGDLARARIAELDALDMIWDPWEEDWEKGFAVARAYQEAHGDLLVPRHFVTSDGFKLGNWIGKQRAKRDRLSSEQITKLDELAMVWDAMEEKWQRGMAASRAYRESKGHLVVPGSFVSDDGFPLGKWISHRRAFRRNGILSAERIAELDALGMVWDARTTI